MDFLSFWWVDLYFSDFINIIVTYSYNLFISKSKAIFFLMKGLSQRKKLSKTERNLEEARIKATGLRLKWLPRVFVVLIFVLVILIFSERKIASWILLGALNFISLGYWINTSRRTESSDDYHEFQEA